MALEAQNQPANSKEPFTSKQEETLNELALIEAALYVSGRPLTIPELCSVLKTRSQRKVKAFVKTLMREYANRNTALEILELKDERYVLQLKAEFTPFVRRLVRRPLLSTGPLKTLAYIALRQPISQKRVVEVRGRHAYGHIKLLKEMGLIASEKRGRSVVLKTTSYFADYFGLSHDIQAMKRELREIIEKEKHRENP
ncbi:MAG: SMC-Scp complex subunit ScpB [Candidatus Bathyarchaeia archaeon]